MSNGKEISKQRMVVYSSSKFGAIWPTNGRDMFVSFDPLSERFRAFFIHIEVTEWNSAKLCPVFGNEPYLKTDVKKIREFLSVKSDGPKTEYFW